MSKSLKEKFIEERLQCVVVTHSGTILNSDQSLFSLSKGSDIKDFHPFFFILPAILENRSSSQTFHCVQFDILGKTSFVDITATVEKEKEEVVFMIEDLTYHYKSVHQIKQVRNESIIQFNVIQELNNQLEVQRGFKNKFIANVSHEVRTPLSSILGFLNILENTSLDREQLDIVQIIKSSSKNLVTIVEDLLDISKVEAGKLEISNKRFDFKKFAQELGATYNLRAQEKRLDFKFKLGENIPNFLIGDQLRLNQVLVNLLENALKYTHTGSISFKITTKSRNARRIPVTFSIEDTGIGIEANDLEGIFESFNQVEKRGLFGGSGLGLSIVKNLCDLMGTSIEVQSIKDKGSTFSFTLSMGVSHDQKGKRLLKKDVPAAALPSDKRYRILLGEDIEINQMMIMKLFSKHKEFSLDIAKNGEKVLDLLDRFKYDLVIMDLTMPVMDGFDATAQIRAHEKKHIQKLPIIALTARTSQEEQELAKEVGINDYLTKPIDEKTLFKSIHRLLNRYKKKTEATAS